MNTSLETYLVNQVRVIGSVRKEKHWKCSEHWSSLNIESTWFGPFRIIAIDKLIWIIKATQKKHLQIITYNFRYSIKNKGISLCKRPNKNAKPSSPLYVAVYFYSSNRSKTLVNWLYFCAGISLLYKSLLELTRDIGNRIILQYNGDGASLLWTLRKGILTIIAKENIDQNSNGTTATRHYHGKLLPIPHLLINEKPRYSSGVGRSRTVTQPTISENQCNSIFQHMR